MNYYDILNITRQADKAALKRAYYEAVKRHSPDSDPEKFKIIRTAYLTLSDDSKRSKYDELFVEDSAAQSDLLYANELIRQNKYKLAVDFLKPSHERHPGSKQIALLLAESLFKLGKSGTAAKLCEELFENDPSNSKAALLHAKIAISRGHSNKALDIYHNTVYACPRDPDAWVDYLNYIVKYYNNNVIPVIAKKAMSYSPDILRSDFALYLACATESRDARDNIKDTLAFLQKYVEFLESDCSSLSRDAMEKHFQYFSLSIKGFDDIIFIPSIEKILSVFSSDMHIKNSQHDKIRVAYAYVAKIKLSADKRIHVVLIDMTTFFILEENDTEERVAMESFIVYNIKSMRKPIKALRDSYPEYFQLNHKFYQDVLTIRKEEFLTVKYYTLSKRLAKGADDALDSRSVRNNRGEFNTDYNDEFDDDDDDDAYNFYGEGDGDDDDDGDDFYGHKPQKPFVRESIKVGRNDPCPCGSGKKYKACCGK